MVNVCILSPIYYIKLFHTWSVWAWISFGGPLDCLFSRFFIGPDSTKETVWVSYDLC